jgi:hypothetical protein
LRQVIEKTSPNSFQFNLDVSRKSGGAGGGGLPRQAFYTPDHNYEKIEVSSIQKKKKKNKENLSIREIQ